VYQKCVKNTKSAIIVAVMMTSCILNCSISCSKKHTADLALVASRFSQALLQESFTSKWWLSSKVEAGNFTKNKLLKLIIMNYQFNENRLSICRLKSEHKYSEKKLQKMNVSWRMF